MESKYALTTIDNPFNPFEQFESWFMFDVEKGYYSCNKLARVANLSEDLTSKEVDEEVERAIDIIIKNDFLDIFTKVEKKYA